MIDDTPAGRSRRFTIRGLMLAIAAVALGSASARGVLAALTPGEPLNQVAGPVIVLLTLLALGGASVSFARFLTRR